MKLIDGKKVSEDIKNNIREEIKYFVSKGHRKPCLAAVIVGDNPASVTYVTSKMKNCELVGIKSELKEFSSDISEKKLLDEIQILNENKEIDGYIVQLPLPKHIDERKINEAIYPKKDVDGFHPVNLGRLLIGDKEGVIPATPYGIVELLKYYDVDTQGKNVVVLGRSNIVGKPMSVLMSRNDGKIGNATVTLCHSKTNNLEEFTKKADIVIVAIGKANFLKGEMVKKGVVVIDVGINRLEDNTKKSGYKLYGDVDFEDVKNKVSLITPVPGGVGPMTIAMLIKNTFLAYKRYYIDGRK